MKNVRRKLGDYGQLWAEKVPPKPRGMWRRTVEHPDRHKTHSWAPVIVYSPEHGHYHKTYHPSATDTRIFPVGN